MTVMKLKESFIIRDLNLPHFLLILSSSLETREGGTICSLYLSKSIDCICLIVPTLFVKEYQLYLLKGIDCICVNTILLILLIRNKGRRNELQRNIQSRGDEFKAVQAAADKKEQAHRTHTYKPPHHSKQRHSFQDSNYHTND